jgi:phage shock protein PspC (stress-responsive transcriptional regulator)
MHGSSTDSRPAGPRGLRDPREWHRDYPDRKLAGVCASLAANLEISVSAVRIAFVLLGLFRGTGLLVYAALWLLLPPRPGEPSTLDGLLRWLKRTAAEARGRLDREPSDPVELREPRS